MNLFDTLLIQPFLNLLIFFYQILESANIPGALGFAIILLTLAIRLILWPLTTSQLKSTQKMTQLKPHLDKLKVTYGDDKLRHQQEITKLYKEHGVNPLSGCLPLILQIPVFIALYQVLLKVVDLGKSDFLESINSQLYSPFLHLNQTPGTSFFGFNLAAKPNEWSKPEIGILVLSIPLVTGILQFIQSKMLLPTNQAKVKKDPKAKESMEDTMASMQSQMALIMPAMIAFFSYGFPVGLSLYWNTFTIIGIIQQYLVSGAGAFNTYLPKNWRK